MYHYKELTLGPISVEFGVHTNQFRVGVGAYYRRDYKEICVNLGPLMLAVYVG